MMEHEFTYVELSDEQLDLVVGGCHHHHHHRHRQTAIAANFGGGFANNLQNANATNQVGFININVTVQNNILIII